MNALTYQCTSKVFVRLDHDRALDFSRKTERWFVCAHGSDTPANAYVYYSLGAAQVARRHLMDGEGEKMAADAADLPDGIHAVFPEMPDLNRPVVVGKCAIAI